MNDRYFTTTENGLQAFDGSELDIKQACPCSASDDDAKPHLRALTLHHFYASVRIALILAVIIRSVLFIGVLCAMPWTYIKRK